jgi:glycosyltransferase involved in cell wall biosynthesis
MESEGQMEALPRSRSAGAARPAVGTVLVVVPGGLEHGGGIGRQMGYALQALDRNHGGVAYRLIDSRGPWFLGASPARTAGALLYLAYAAMQLLRARLTFAPHLAHVNITGRGSTIRKLMLTALARGIGLRYLLHVHDADYADDFAGRGRLVQKLVARMFQAAESVIVLGSRDQKLLANVFDLPLDRVTILHNAVPDPQPAIRSARPPGTPCRFLFLGHLSERKGVPELLHALASPPLAARQWRAVIAGSGPVDEFRSMAASLGIADRVHLPGWVDKTQVRALAADADVLVLPSHAEGLAMAVLEGLSHGLAVVATPVGAHSEVIEPGVSGLFVPPGDVGALAETLARVIDDSILRERLGTGARRRFLAKFDVNGYADRLSRLHADLLSRSHRAARAVEKAQIT